MQAIRYPRGKRPVNIEAQVERTRRKALFGYGQVKIAGLGATPCDFHVEEGPQPGCDLCREINAPKREP